LIILLRPSRLEPFAIALILSPVVAVPGVLTIIPLVIVVLVSHGYLTMRIVVVIVAVLLLWLLYLFPLSSSGDRVRLLLQASSPSVNLFAMSINSDTVLGLIRPISSTRSPRRNPSVHASIALSSETTNVEFLIMLHHCMYDLSVLLHCCMQTLTSSIDAGRLYVDLKLLVNCLVSSSQVPIVSLSSLLNQDRVALVR
jgi:hypothetical protein